MPQFNSYPTVPAVAPDDTILIYQQSSGAVKQTTNSAARGEVATISALRQINTTTVANGARITVKGYYAAGDGAEGDFIFNSSSSDADNSGTIIAPATGSGRWIRQFIGPVDIRWFGAKVDGTTTDTTAVQAAHDYCLSAAKVLKFPSGTTKTGKINWRGVSLLGDGSNITYVLGLPGQDVFRVGDPTAGEDGSSATLPEYATIEGLTVLVDCSVHGSFATRTHWPIFGTWSGSTPIQAGDYYTTGTGKVYLCTVGGTTGSVAPTHTSGVATDGTVQWYYCDSTQRTWGQAGFALPLLSGASAQSLGVQYGVSWQWKDVQIRNKDANANPATNEVAIFCQRPLYANTFESVYCRFLAGGFIATGPYTGASQYEGASDTTAWLKCDTKCTVGMRWMGGYFNSIRDLNTYSSQLNDVGFQLLPIRYLQGFVGHNWNVTGLYQEQNGGTIIPVITVGGYGHTFEDCGFSSGGGTPFVDIICNNSVFTGCQIANAGAATPPLRIWGNMNVIEAVQTGDIFAKVRTLFVSDKGMGNRVSVSAVTGHEFESERKVLGAVSRPDMGTLFADFLMKGCYSNSFYDTLIGFREMRTVSDMTRVADASLETGGYIAITDFSAGYASNYSCRDLNTVGTRFPGGKCRVIVKGKVAVNTAAFIGVSVISAANVRTLLSATNFNWTTDWQTFALDVDFTGYGPLDAGGPYSIQIELSNPTVTAAQTQYAAWAAVVPYSVEDAVIKVLFPTTATITSGTGVPATTEPDGSVYLKTGAAPNLYVRQAGAWVAK